MQKANRLFLPLVYLSLGFLVVFTTIHDWLLSVYPRLDLQHPDLMSISLPMILSLLLAFFLIGPRIMLLDLDGHSGNWPLGFVLLAAVTIGTPAILLQKYLVSAFGKMTSVQDVGDIAQQPLAQSYTVAHYFADTAHAGMTKGVYRSSSRSFDLSKTLRVYIAVPLRSQDTAERGISAWVGLQYDKKIAGAGDSENIRALTAFYTDCRDDFHALDLQHFTYLRRVVDHDSITAFLQAVENSSLLSMTDPPMVFTEVKDPLSFRGSGLFVWVAVTLIAGWGIWAFCVFNIPFRTVAPSEPR